MKLERKTKSRMAFQRDLDKARAERGLAFLCFPVHLRCRGSSPAWQVQEAGGCVPYGGLRGSAGHRSKEDRNTHAMVHHSQTHWLGITPGRGEQQTEQMLDAQPPVINRIRM